MSNATEARRIDRKLARVSRFRSLRQLVTTPGYIPTLRTDLGMSDLADAYAANKVIAAALLDTSRGNSFTPCDIELVSDALCNLENDALRRIASIIAAGLQNSDDVDSVDQAEVGRLITEVVYSQAKSMLAEEIAREEADEAAETQADIDADLRAMDNAERVRDMRSAA